MGGYALHTIAHGDLGIMQTVGKMREVVHASLTEPLPVTTARAISSGYCCAGERAQAIRDFLKATVNFTPDPVGVEWISTPDQMLREIEARGLVQGDCDDVAVLAASLGMAVGMPARFVLLGFNPHLPFFHVYTELQTSQGWAEMDVTAPAQFPPGLTVEKEKRIVV